MKVHQKWGLLILNNKGFESSCAKIFFFDFLFESCAETSSICNIKIRTMPSRIIYETAKFREPISRKKGMMFYTTFFKKLSIR